MTGGSSLLDILPADNEVGTWVQTGGVELITDQTGLFNRVDGAAPKYIDRGWVSSVYVNYSQGSRTIQVAIHDMGNNADAQAIYNYVLPPARLPIPGLPNAVVDLGLASAYAAYAFVDRFYIELNITEKSDAALTAIELFMSDILNRISRGCPDAGSAPDAGGDGNIGTGGADGAGPNMCPSTVPGTGSRCVSAGEACAYDGCTACVCMSNGTWECTSGPGDCASCPTTVTAGSPCSSNGLTCLRWAFCGSACSCDGTTWSCGLCGGGACGGSACSSPPSCPGTLPNDGETCGALGNSCLYAWPAGCVRATCSCTVAGWLCSYGNYCQDAGLGGADGSQASCRTDKIEFSQQTGCANDGSVEFCLPAGDAAALAEVLAVDATITCTQGQSGRAGCDGAEQLCQLPVQCPSYQGPMPDGEWQTVCQLAALDVVTSIVPTLYE